MLLFQSFATDLLENFPPLIGVKFLIEPAQGYTNHVAMADLGTRSSHIARAKDLFRAMAQANLGFVAVRTSYVTPAFAVERSFSDGKVAAGACIQRRMSR